MFGIVVYPTICFLTVIIVRFFWRNHSFFDLWDSMGIFDKHYSKERKKEYDYVLHESRYDSREMVVEKRERYSSDPVDFFSNLLAIFIIILKLFWNLLIFITAPLVMFFAVKYIKKAIVDEKARAEQEAKIKAEQEDKVKAEQERRALKQASGLNQNNVFDYIKKFLVTRGYNPDDYILNNPIGNGPQAPSDTPSSFDVKYQEKDGTGAGMFRVTRTLDSRVQVTKFVGSNLDTDGGAYVIWP